MENLQRIEEQMIEAKLKKPDIVHFLECAISRAIQEQI